MGKKIKTTSGLAAAAMMLVTGCMTDGTDTGSIDENSAISSDLSTRWPHTIHYVIDVDGTYAGKNGAHCTVNNVGASGLPMPSGADNIIRDALGEYSDTTPITFEEFQPGDEPSGPFLIYTLWADPSGDSHASTGGMPTDGKPACVLLSDDGTFSVGTVLHETGHELGTPHEQKRADAWNPGGVIFDPQCTANQDAWTREMTGFENLAPYDYASIMEYASTSLCDTTQPGCNSGTTANPVCAHPPLVKNIPGCVAGSTAAACQIARNKDLSLSDVNVLYRAYEQRLGLNEPGDHFASALAVGDFDGDGFLDLAVGSPGEDVPGNAGGAVFLYKGTSSATAGTLGRLVAWKTLVPEGNDLFTHFGEALAVGDFNGDGVDDLAISAPGSFPGGDEVLGAGLFVYSAIKLNYESGGTSRKMVLSQEQYLTEINLGIPLQTADRFGASLSAGDFNGDGIDDLAVGIPHRTTGGVDGGAVQILTGVHNGRLARGALLTAASLSGSSVASGERFGVAVLAKNFEPEISPRADLIVGAPGTAATARGHAYVFRGTSTGITAQSKLQSNNAGPSGDRFGDSLAAGDFDGRTISGQRIPYLAIGADGESGGFGGLYVFARASSGFTFSLSEGFDEPTGGASNHFGAVLGTGVVDSSGNEALLVGVPGHPGGGNVDIYRHTSGFSAPLQAPFVSTGFGTHAGDDYGSAIATGDFTGVAGTQNEIVVGSSGANSGAGHVRLGDVTGASSMSWQSLIDQESASPE